MSLKNIYNWYNVYMPHKAIFRQNSKKDEENYRSMGSHNKIVVVEINIK